MAKGLSIHLGLNSVDPKHYNGWDGQLRACENDARDMQQIADSQGYHSVLLLTGEATSDHLLKQLAVAASTLSKGDILFLTYSGHGGQMPDVNGDEDDGYDETWCLYDRQFIDDEFSKMWAQFEPGVRIVMLSDSCHSGTVAKFVPMDTAEVKPKAEQAYAASKLMPPSVGIPTYEANQRLYDSIQWSTGAGEKEPIAASVILISGCKDDQTSADGQKNGLFTAALLKVWAKGTFQGPYLSFSQEIIELMPKNQTPNFYRVGAINSAFEQQNPFSIGTDKGFANGADHMSKCQFVLDVDRDLLGASDDDVRGFLSGEGCNALLKAFRSSKGIFDEVSRSKSLPKGVDVSAGCTSANGGSCSGTVTWHT